MSVPRTERLAEEIRQQASDVLGREVHDPGVGFVTVTRVIVTPDLQLARVYYTVLGDASARTTTAKALARIRPFVRRRLGDRLRLRHVPDVQFVFDESIAHQARVEELLQEIHVREAERRDDVPKSGDPHDGDE